MHIKIYFNTTIHINITIYHSIFKKLIFKRVFKLFNNKYMKLSLIVYFMSIFKSFIILSYVIFLEFMLYIVYL